MAIYGASGTDPLLESMGVLKTLGGSAKAGQQAMDFANQLYPQSTNDEIGRASLVD